MIGRIILAITCIVTPEVVSAGVAASLWQLQEGSPLMRAAQEGDVVKVQAFLDRGQNVNEQTKNSGATPLIFAASAGKVETVKLLLKRRADPNLCSWANVCPAWWAVGSTSAYMVIKALVEAGADVNKQVAASSLEHPILQIAASSGRIDIVKLLLDHGIEVDYSNAFSENTALAWAVASGQDKVAQMLIDHNASLGDVTEVPYFKGEMTALEHAKKMGYKAAVEVVENALKSGKYNRPKYSVDPIIDKLYRDPAFDLSTQDKDLVNFLRKQTTETLRRIRNTIFARKNYQFDDPQLVEYFRKKFPSYRSSTRKYDMSDVDKRNVKFMQEIEEYRAARDSAG